MDVEWQPGLVHTEGEAASLTAWTARSGGVRFRLAVVDPRLTLEEAAERLASHLEAVVAADTGVVVDEGGGIVDRGLDDHDPVMRVSIELDGPPQVALGHGWLNAPPDQPSLPIRELVEASLRFLGR